MLIPLGRVVITRNALNSLVEGEWFVGLARHARGDWGDVCQEDKDANDFASKETMSVDSVGYFGVI